MSASDEIKRNNRALCAALEAGDVSSVVDRFTDDALFLMPGAPMIRGSEGLRSWWESFAAAGTTKARMSTLHVEERGDLAIEVGQFEMDMEPPGAEPLKQVGKYAVGHRREPSNELKMWIDCINSDTDA